MAQRILDVILAFAGLIVVAALVLWGIDAYRAAQTGPHWRRRLVTAALALLAAIGAPACSTDAAPPDATKPSSTDASADWQAIHGAWAAAVPLASGGKSTTAQRTAADAKINAAHQAAKRLVAKGLLASQEADLLGVELANLHEDIYRNPPTDTQVMCYDMAYLPPAQQSLQRLNKRLPLVEKLLEGGKVNPVAGGKIIAGIQADLAILNDAKNMQQLPAGEQEAAKAARDKAQQALKRLYKFIPPPPTCYERMPLPEPKPKSQGYLNQRLERLAAAERGGRLSPAVAGRVRKAIEAEMSNS